MPPPNPDPSPFDPTNEPAVAPGSAAGKPAIPDYELVRVIGQGSYGDVWLARGLTGVYRAIKIVWRDRFPNAEPFEREFKGLKQFMAMARPEAGQLALLHVGQNETAGFFYYVMELADDVATGDQVSPATYAPLTLKEVRTEHHRLPAATCVRYGVELARALAGLHSRGLVHRDIKPSNVILVGGVPKLADIGLVAAAGEALTYVGTEGFLPPEGPGKPGADVFALGRLLYELATGLDRAEFPRLPPELAQAPDRKLFFRLNEIILRACDPAPDRRYRDAPAMLADLLALPAGSAPRRTGGRTAWAIGLVALGLSAAVGGIWWKERSVATAPGPAVAGGSAPAKSVAVLPFANLSDDKSNEYFSDGISEELLNVLAQIPGLKVTARTSAFYFKGKNVSAAEIGRQLGVGYLVEGSVRKAGGKVRIAAQLIKASDGFEVWSDHYDRELTDVFAVQDEIAGVIARKFQLTLGEAAHADRTVNPEAYQLYLQGIYLLNQYSVESAARAAGLLQRSIDLDPSFAPAWAALSFTGIMRGGFASTRQDAEEGYSLARRAAEHSLALDPGFAFAYAALATIQTEHDFNWKGAAESLDRAQALAPANADVVDRLASLAYALGQSDRAVALDAQAVALNPLDTSVRVNYGFTLCAARRFPEAEAEFRRTIELDPTALWGHAGLSFNFTVQGRYDEAAVAALQESNEWSRLFTLAIAQWGQKKVPQSDATLAQLIKAYGDVAAYQVAEAYAFRHDNDPAFEWLERAYRQRDPGLSRLKLDPLLGDLRKDPRWDPFLRQLGLADDQLK